MMQPLPCNRARVVAALRAAPVHGLLFEDVRRFSGFVGTNDALELLLGSLRRARHARVIAGRWLASGQGGEVSVAPEVSAVAPEVSAVAPEVVAVALEVLPVAVEVSAAEAVSVDVSAAVSVVMGVVGSVDALVAAECERLTRMIDWHLQQLDVLQRHRESLLAPFGGA